MLERVRTGQSHWRLLHHSYSLHCIYSYIFNCIWYKIQIHLVFYRKWPVHTCITNFKLAPLLDAALLYCILWYFSTDVFHGVINVLNLTSVNNVNTSVTSALRSISPELLNYHYDKLHTVMLVDNRGLVQGGGGGWCERMWIQESRLIITWRRLHGVLSITRRKAEVPLAPGGWYLQRKVHRASVWNNSPRQSYRDSYRKAFTPSCTGNTQFLNTIMVRTKAVFFILVCA